MLSPVGIEPGPLKTSDSFYTNLTFACKTENLGSLYSHALLIPTKYQAVHEQKFKDLLSSTCQVSVERIVLDLESEVLRGLGSIPTGGNILSQDFFHVVKPLMKISSNLWKTRFGIFQSLSWWIRLIEQNLQLNKTRN